MTGKLYGTLGPACADTDTLRALLRAGMRGVRLNLSHGPLAERAPWLESLRRAETAEGVSCDLLIDLQGPELRVGAIPAPLTLREGDTLTLGEAFPVPPILTGNLQDGDELLLDDVLPVVCFIRLPGIRMFKRRNYNRCCFFRCRACLTCSCYLHLIGSLLRDCKSSSCLTIQSLIIFIPLIAVRNAFIVKHMRCLCR